MEKIKIAVIGHGHLGKWHCEKVQISQDVELAYIVEPSSDQRTLAKKKYPATECVESIDQIKSSIDAAFIVTPTSSHFKIAMYLIEKGIPFFCEKPLCSNLADGQKLQELILQQNLLVQVGHSERFHACWEDKDKNERFFKGPATISIIRQAAFKGRATDVDVVSDLMIHDLDLLLYLFNEWPERVYSTGYKSISNNWDYVCSEFLFPSNRRAILTVGRHFVKEQRSFEICNQHGTYLVDLNENKIYRSDNSNGTVEITEYPKRDHLLLEHQSFYRALRNKTKPLININDGVNVLKLANSVWEGLEKNKEILIS